jgi:hypothetical protein
VVAQSLNEGVLESRNAARKLMLQSLGLSRRDLPTHLWLIEDYGKQGDVRRMVGQFDMALRSSQSPRTGVFGLLTAAAQDPKVKEIIVHTVSRRPNWAIPFASYAIGNAADVDFVARIALILFDPTREADREHILALMRRLVDSNRASLAWKIYGQLRNTPSGESLPNVRAGDFESAGSGTPFDWSFAQEPELWASREGSPEGSGLVLQVAAYNGRAGEVAHQILKLSSGPHRLRARMGGLPANIGERPEIRVECVAKPTGRLIATLRSTDPHTTSHEVSAAFLVPPDCAFQRLSIYASGDGPLGDPIPWVDGLRID